MEDKKLNKTIELILLTQFNGKVTQNTQSTQSVHKSIITRKNILGTNQLKTQQIMSSSTTNAFISTWNTGTKILYFFSMHFINKLYRIDGAIPE